MSRAILLRVLAVVALLVAGLALDVAPASAAPKPIGLSDDGVTFADYLPASLFDGAVIVPGHAATRSFWVKNRMTTPGNLAIAVHGVAGADEELTDALAVNAVVGAAASPDIPLPAAGACNPLVSAVALAPDAIMRVDVTLGLDASLHAHATQGSLGAFDVGVTMTSTDVAAPDGCSSVDPPDGGGGSGAGGDAAGGTTPAIPGESDTAIVAGAAGESLPDAGGAPGDSGLPDATGSGAGAAIASGDSGVSGFLPWIALAACLIALVLGGIFAAWRRTRYRENRRA